MRRRSCGIDDNNGFNPTIDILDNGNGEVVDTTIAIAGGIGAVALAMLPDYDQRVPVITHRGIADTAWFALLVGAVLSGVGLADAGQHPLATVAAALFAGCVGVVTVGSHISADALTPAGVRPFVSLQSRQYTAGFVRAANPIANDAPLGVAVAGGAFVAGAALVGG